MYITCTSMRMSATLTFQTKCVYLRSSHVTLISSQSLLFFCSATGRSKISGNNESHSHTYMIEGLYCLCYYSILYPQCIQRHINSAQNTIMIQFCCPWCQFSFESSRESTYRYWRQSACLAFLTSLYLPKLQTRIWFCNNYSRC